MKVKIDAVLREIAGDYVLVPVGDTVTTHNGLFALSEVGAYIWELLPLCESEEEITDKLLEEFDAPRETVKADVSEFLSALREMGLID